jgi:hypothetical protein
MKMEQRECSETSAYKIQTLGNYPEENDAEHDFEEEEEEENYDDNKPQHKSKHRLQQVMDYQPGDHLKEGTQIFTVLSVQQEV